MYIAPCISILGMLHAGRQQSWNGTDDIQGESSRRHGLGGGAERQAASYKPQVPTHLEFLQVYSMPV